MEKYQLSLGWGTCSSGMLSEAASVAGVGAGVGAGAVYEGMVPERAASIEKPKEGLLKRGGSIRVKPLAVLRRLRMPTRLRVGERPAGAVNGVLCMPEVDSLIGERAASVGLRGAGATTLLNSVGDGGALVKKKPVGFSSDEVPLDFLGEKKSTGLMFSVSSSSKVSALRLRGEVRVGGRAKGGVRFEGNEGADSERAREKGLCTIVTVLEAL